MDRKTVKLKWVDPFSIDEWTSIEDLPEVLCIESFGYEVHKDDKCAVIALNYDPTNDKMSCATVIPQECIKEYMYLDREDD